MDDIARVINMRSCDVASLSLRLMIVNFYNLLPPACHIINVHILFNSPTILLYQHYIV